MQPKPKHSPSDEVLVQKIGGEAVLLHLKNQEYYGLNEVGTRIWELLVEHKTEAQVVDTICTEFEVARETAIADINGFLSHLQNDRLIDDKP